MDTAIAISHPRLGDLFHPFLQVGLIGAAPTIVAVRSLRPEHPAGPPDADLPSAADTVDELPAPAKPQNCRETTYCNIALSRLKSATNRFSLAFSSSKLAQPSHLQRHQPRMLLAPRVRRRLADSGLPAHVTDAHAIPGLLQHGGDLRLRKLRPLRRSFRFPGPPP